MAAGSDPRAVASHDVTGAPGGLDRMAWRGETAQTGR
jgi:hypothetical protein